MAINYNWHEAPVSPTQEYENKLYPRITTNGWITTKEIKKRIHQSCSLTEGDVTAAISALSDIIAYELADGRQVHIEGIGYFYPTLTTSKPVTSDMTIRQRSRFVELKAIKFKPDKEMTRKIGIPNFRYYRHVGHSDKLSEVEIDIRLKEYFSTRRVMTRNDFQRICGFKRTKALTELTRLRQEGKLRNINTCTQPIYTPVPGFYGVSHDSAPLR
jgi:predicted histone-like DNA-binding protein